MSHDLGQLWASRRGTIVHYTYGDIFLEYKPSVTEIRILLDNNEDTSLCLCRSEGGNLAIN